jgi:hypothetical protein
MGSPQLAGGTRRLDGEFVEVPASFFGDERAAEEP